MMQDKKSISRAGLILTGIVLLAGLFGGTSAFGQTAACRRINQQIAALDQEANNPDFAARTNRQAEIQSGEASRLANRMRNIGCDEQSELLGGGSGECSMLAAKVQVHRQNAIRLRSESTFDASSSFEGRRQALLASYEAYNCRADNNDDRFLARPAPGRATRGDSLFDQSGRSSVTIVPPRPVDPFAERPFTGTDPFEPNTQPEAKRGFGGVQPVCVRLCDGFFFPLAGASSRSDAKEMCKAQCPVTESRVFYRTPEGDINGAVDDEDRSYTSLPNALKYRTRMDAACTCKKSGQSWSATLQPAEKLIENGNGDVVVTDKTADEIASGKSGLLKTDTKKKPVRKATGNDNILGGTLLRP